MVKDAQEHETEDKKRREAIDARNQLESMTFQVQKHVDENKDKLVEADRNELEAALKDAKDVLEANREPKDPDALKAAFERLQKASHKMAEALYKNAAAAGGEAAGAPGAPGGGEGGGAAPGGKDDVIDAEYTDAPKNT
jgi:molecular chaperone DnaK